MLVELILFCAVTGLLVLPAVLSSGHRDFIHIASFVSGTAMPSGAFVSVVRLLVTISRFERIVTDGIPVDNIPTLRFVLIFFVCLRPLLFGIGTKLLVIGATRFCREEDMPPAPESGASPFDLLSPREREVAALAAKGCPNAQIAEELFISIETVKRHMATIFKKLGISSRLELRKLESLPGCSEENS